MEATLTAAPPVVEKQLNPFERYLTVWVALCMVAGVVLGQAAPGFVHTLRTMEFGQGSHINLPIAVLIWLMIVPMMMMADLASIRHVGARPTGLVITLFGAESGAALATVVGGLVEMPVMLSVCGICNRTRHWFTREAVA